jgi:hypothetical protein
MTSRTLYNWLMDGAITHDDYLNIINAGKMTENEAHSKLITDVLLIQLIASVQGTSGDGDTATGFITGEIVIGTPDGSRTTFTVLNTFVDDSEQVFVNGQSKLRGAGYDYVPTGTSKRIVFNAGCIPILGDRVWMNYRKV